jgi:HSP20 family protein
MFPADPLTTLRGAVSKLFDEFTYGTEEPWFRTTPSFPALNVWEDNDNLYVEAEIPGVKPEDIEASAIGRELTIHGRRQPAQDPNLTYHRQERGTGEFTRVLELPVEVDTENVQAGLKDGILTVTLPKSRSAKARKIEVKAI